MTNKKVDYIEKLSDDLLENVSGGLFDQKTKNGLQTGGEITAAVGLIGFATCAIAGSICQLKGNQSAKGLLVARDMFMGVAALGGASYAVGKAG